MKHVIIFPYYCRQEIDAFTEIARIWEVVTRTSLEYEFLLSSRFDCSPSLPLEKEVSRVAPVRSIRCVTPGRGLFEPTGRYSIAGSTAMFWDTMEHINKSYDKDGGFVLWFEADMVPLTPDWLDVLDRQWQEGKYLIMGKLIDRAWVKTFSPRWLPHMVEHINGGACYSKGFCQKMTRDRFDLKNPWDYEIFPYLKEQYPGMFKVTDCIEFRYNQPALRESPSSTAVLLHGIKDASARRYVCQKFDIDYHKIREGSAIGKTASLFSRREVGRNG